MTGNPIKKYHLTGKIISGPEFFLEKILKKFPVALMAPEFAAVLYPGPVREKTR